MNTAYAVAFLGLRVSDRVTVAQQLNVLMAQGGHETNDQYGRRLLQMIEKEGKVRELEQALMQYH